VPAWMFDSVVLIDYYRNRPAVIAYFEMVLNQEATGAFSTITELELWQGIRPGEEERHQAMLALLERVPLDGATSPADRAAPAVAAGRGHCCQR